MKKIPVHHKSQKQCLCAGSLYEHKDWFQTLPDFNAYVVRKGQALSDYACDPMDWRKKCLVNIAKAGMFSSDRTIAEYNRDIWHLGK